MKKTLPNKPSALIRTAVADLRQVERLKSYAVDMSTFHSGTTDPKNDPCAVCFAGAVIARTLETPITKSKGPHQFPADTRKKLCALDTLRSGDVSAFLNEGFNKRLPAGINIEANIVEYGYDPTDFKRGMLSVAKFLEEINL